MKFELKALEQLIDVTVNPAKLTKSLLTNEFIIECKWLLKLEIEKVIEALNSAGISDTGSKCAEIYFRHYQIGITQLSDKVLRYKQHVALESPAGGDGDESLNSLYPDIIEKLEQLLEYAYTMYPVYFDKSLKITDAKKNLLQSETSSALKLIDKELRKIGVPETLINIACVPFKEFSSPDKPVSYQEVSFLRVYGNEFIGFIAGISNRKNALNQFYELLIYINFNSARFYNFIIMDIQENAESFRRIPEQIVQLYIKLKWLNQLQVKPGLALRPEMPTLKEQLRSWISEELVCLEKQRQFMVLDDEKQDEQGPDEKIQTSLSVGHLSLFVKLLVDSKKISNKNPSELMRMVASNFKTDRHDNISENSIRNKYYSVESGTLSSMKDVLNGLVNLVTEYED